MWAISASLLLSLLCAWMVSWIVLFPGSWRAGLLPASWVDLNSLMEVASTAPAPIDVFSKYRGHAAVVLLHHLPGAVWMAGIPLQFSPLRTQKPKLHRAVGYCILTSSCALAVGVHLIQRRGLGLAQGVEVVEWGVYAVNAWHVFTCVYAVSLARRGQYKEHSQWMYRHTASGIWVAVQRVFAILLASLEHMGLMIWSTASHELRSWVFGRLAQVSILLCLGGCEWAIYRQTRRAAVKGD